MSGDIGVFYSLDDVVGLFEFRPKVLDLFLKFGDPLEGPLPSLFRFPKPGLQDIWSFGAFAGTTVLLRSGTTRRRKLAQSDASCRRNRVGAHRIAVDSLLEDVFPLPRWFFDVRHGRLLKKAYLLALRCVKHGLTEVLPRRRDNRDFRGRRRSKLQVHS